MTRRIGYTDKASCFFLFFSVSPCLKTPCYKLDKALFAQKTRIELSTDYRYKPHYPFKGFEPLKGLKVLHKKCKT